MKINSLEIVDVKNKEANKFTFSDNVNLIVSKKNGGGKSSLIKSIYYALGFDILNFPENWNFTDMYFVTELTIKDDSYKVIRQNNVFKIEDCDKSLDAKQYSEWLQDKLGDKIYLPNKYTENLETAYATAFILPFYIDQDSSWHNSIYRGVSNTLGMYKNMPKAVFEALLGLSSVKIVESENEIIEAKRKQNKLKIAVDTLSDTFKKYENNNVVAEMNPELLNKEIHHYLSIMNDLSNKISDYKIKIIKKQSELDVQKQDLSELKELIKLNHNSYKHVKLECSYCHSKYTDDISLNRFDLENNRLEIEMYTAQTEKKVHDIEEDINKLFSNQNELKVHIKSVEEKIATSKSLTDIHEYVDDLAKDKAAKELINILEVQTNQLNVINSNLIDLKKELSRLKKSQKDRKKDLADRFNSVKNDVKMSLTDVDLTERDFLQFQSMPGSGMRHNEKLLAYYLIYFKLLKDYSAFDIPFGMDSFIKNESEESTLKTMFQAVEKFFFDSEKQCFFSLVESNKKFLYDTKRYNVLSMENRILSKEYYSKNY
ncbi:hypothetical protein EFM21_00460 [Leuconostoc falkenbergense]|uniref:hypothetical protein n=1 Tax=Leuconostoc falkenbergense TaxID=2766470 RepID=UPI0021AACA20|nr:hypothetical protein [Leuconostoc falkenbergense]MCT4377651.1 hypothetical protein [Leuconostoc falkenbergense]